MTKSSYKGVLWMGMKIARLILDILATVSVLAVGAFTAYFFCKNPGIIAH